MKELDIHLKKMRLKEYQEKHPQNTISLKNLSLSDEAMLAVKECINQNKNFKIYVKNILSVENSSQSVTFVDTSMKSLSNLVAAFDQTKSQEFEYNTSPSKRSISSVMKSPDNKRRRLSVDMEIHDQHEESKGKEVSTADEPIRCSQPHTSTQAFTQPFPLTFNMSPIAPDSQQEHLGKMRQYIYLFLPFGTYFYRKFKSIYVHRRFKSFV